MDPSIKKGTFKCTHCGYFLCVMEGRDFILLRDRLFESRHYADFKMAGVDYLFNAPVEPSM